MKYIKTFEEFISESVNTLNEATITRVEAENHKFHQNAMSKEDLDRKLKLAKSLGIKAKGYDVEDDDSDNKGWNYKTYQSIVFDNAEDAKKFKAANFKETDKSGEKYNPDKYGDHQWEDNDDDEDEEDEELESTFWDDYSNDIDASLEDIAELDPKVPSSKGSIILLQFEYTVNGSKGDKKRADARVKKIEGYIKDLEEKIKELSADKTSVSKLTAKYFEHLIGFYTMSISSRDMAISKATAEIEKACQVAKQLSKAIAAEKK